MIRNLTGKNSRYESVFLDLDGTITDSYQGMYNGVKYMFGKIGFTDYDESSLKGFFGPAVVQHLVKEFGFAAEKADEAYGFYKEYYLSKGIFESRLYEGIEEAVEKIRASGKAVYLATAKPEYQAVRIIEHFGLSRLFDGVFGAIHEEGIFGKPEVLKRTVETLGDVKNAVMVGDRFYDIEGGKSVGFDTVGVLYGYGGIEELTEAGCDFLADSPRDLCVLLGRACQ